MISRGDSPQLALDHFEPQQVTFARELRGMTKKELSERIRKTPSAVSQIERGIIRPDLETFVRISMALQTPTTFFMKTSYGPPIDLNCCHFRAKRATSLVLRKQSARMGEILINFIELLERKGVVFPGESISSFNCSPETPHHIEKAAADLRAHWGLGLGPIPNIVRLVESKGIIVLPLFQPCVEVDAYSTWRGNRPCILMSMSKTASRARFDIAHELGHLVLHEDAPTGDVQTERQAHRFASAFLAPRESFLRECPRSWSLEAFRKLKFRWKISISALLYRARELGCLSASTYQRAMVQISPMRTDEGPEWDMERPALIEQALELLRDRVSLSTLAAELRIYSSQLKEFLSPCLSGALLEKLDRRAEDEDNETKVVKLREDI
jgi:Zn-dependent peptidase ImmA (M78 family)/transcriptional regulator with XRE-family HTH domain